MTQNYGGSFAQRLIDQGKFDEAIASATKEIDRDPADPEPVVVRATALAALGRFTEALGDLDKALALDKTADVLEVDFVDDAYFESLLGEARARQAHSPTEAAARLAHYRSVFPRGRHLTDVERFGAQLRGERDDSVIVKEREG